jgi:hypothetical protein
VWYTVDEVRRECQWAGIFQQVSGASLPLAGFGSSDCQCRAHLFYFQRRPSFRAFRQRLVLSTQGHSPMKEAARMNVIKIAAADVARPPGAGRTRP